jgi:hypothetical protein
VVALALSVRREVEIRMKGKEEHGQLLLPEDNPFWCIASAIARHNYKL